MDNYVLAEGDCRVDCPIPFPAELATEWRFELKKNTKLGNMLPRMTKELKKDDVRRILLYATGENCAKCVACAEVFKSTMRDTPLYQWTELGNVKSTDVWAPAADNRLDRIVVEKFKPAVFILFSRDPFPEAHRRLGQQSTPEAFPSFLRRANRPSLDAAGGVNSARGAAPPAATKRRDNQWRRQPRQKRPRNCAKLTAVNQSPAAAAAASPQVD